MSKPLARSVSESHLDPLSKFVEFLKKERYTDLVVNSCFLNDDSRNFFKDLFRFLKDSNIRLSFIMPVLSDNSLANLAIVKDLIDGAQHNQVSVFKSSIKCNQASLEQDESIRINAASIKNIIFKNERFKLSNQKIFLVDDKESIAEINKLRLANNETELPNYNSFNIVKFDQDFCYNFVNEMESKKDVAKESQLEQQVQPSSEPRTASVKMLSRILPGRRK